MEIFEPLSPGMLADPYPIYATLRREDPVHRHDGLDAWIITRYADCVRVLNDHSTFQSDFRVIGEHTPEESLTLQTLDPPEHTALRKTMLRALRAGDLGELDRQVDEVVEKRLADLNLERFDFISEFAEPVAISVMCAYFGIPAPDDDTAFRMAQRALLQSFDSGLAPETLQPGLDARSVLGTMIEPWLDRPPLDGLLSRIDHRRVTSPKQQIVNALRGIFGAGYGSSSSMWGNAMHTMARHDLLDKPVPQNMTPVVFNELIRFDGAVQAGSRAVAEDVIVAGRRLRRGDVVITVLGSANRDGERFADADELFVDRHPNPHIGFGMGVHSCIGGQIALKIGVRTFGHLLRRLRVDLADEPVRRRTATLRGFDHLPLRARPR